MTRPRPSLGAGRRRQDGIALLEALLAAVILAIGLLGTIGLQARAYGALSDAGMRAEAAIAANRLLGIMHTDLQHLEDYAVAAGAEPPERLEQWYDETARLIPGAAIEVRIAAAAAGVPAPSRVDIAISWRRKAGTPVNTHRISAYIAGST